MLLERLAAQSAQPPEYDWHGYYRWFFGQLVGREVAGVSFWLCRHCLSVNAVSLPARYGKCRGCELIQMIPAC